jgi:DNA-binding NarL/FixJ family response regulator
MLAEYLANRALALACVGQTMDALALATEATGLSALPEVGALVRCVRAIVAVRADAGEPDDATIDEALTFVFDRSLFDPLVVSYRGFPELLRVAASSKERERILVHVLTEARDTQLARAMGINLPAAPDASQSELSPRENEVLDLLGLGYSNREIAAALYIAETTAKVHVRQILRKLGVRSRTEAALVAARRRAG